MSGNVTGVTLEWLFWWANVNFCNFLLEQWQCLRFDSKQWTWYKQRWFRSEPNLSEFDDDEFEPTDPTGSDGDFDSAIQDDLPVNR